MTGGDDASVELDLRFFATFREAVGSKEITRAFDAGNGGTVDVGTVLAALEDEFPELAGELLEDGGIRPQLSVLKNGREVVHLEGTATGLDDGDRLSVFPPVAGGSMAETRQFRGISLRLAIQYLETLGGERVDGDGVDEAGAGDASADRNDGGDMDEGSDADARADPVRVEDDDWTAELYAETVEPVGSFTLTEVTIDFEGDPDAVERLVEAFSRKAMRAGG